MASLSIIARQPRKRFANLDAVDVGRDRPPRPGDFLGGVGLEIEHVLMRRPADQVDQDDRFVRRAHARRFLGPQKLRQRKPSDAETANLEETATR